MDDRPQRLAANPRSNVANLEGRLLYRVAEAADLCGFARSTGYLLAASGEWPVIRRGRSIRIPAAGLMRWIEQQQDAGS